MCVLLTKWFEDINQTQCSDFLLAESARLKTEHDRFLAVHTFLHYYMQIAHKHDVYMT